MKPRSFLIAAALIAASLPAIYQIITPGYFPIHDDTQVVRVFQMHKAFSAGQFPVRWVPDLGYGYGYPIFNFYNPLPYYFGAGFMFLGLDALAAAKIMFVFPIILSGLTMYLFSKSLLPRWGAFLASTLYIYAPYHAIQIYVRGAVAEYWAYAILPLVFYAIWKNKIIVGGISLAALTISHNLTAFMSIPFIALSILIKFFENKNKLLFTIHYSLFTAFALGASAFFWLPAVFEANKTQVSQMVFEKFDQPSLHLIKPLQLWSGQWGWGGSSSGTDDGLSLQLGKVHLIGGFAAIVILLTCYLVILIKNKSKFLKLLCISTRYQDNKIAIFSILGLTFSLIMMLPVSKPIWNSLPLLSYIQFPWRFLTFASLFSSILAAWTIWKLLPHALLIVFCSLFLVSSLKFFQPQFKYPTSAEELTSRDRILWEVSRRSDEYLPVGFTRPTTPQEALRVDNPLNQKLVDELKHPTPVRRLGNTVSAITIIGMIGYYERLYRRHRH